MVKHRRRGGDDRKTTQRSRALAMLEKSNDDVEFPAAEGLGTALPPKEAKMLEKSRTERSSELESLRSQHAVTSRSPSPTLAGKRRKTRRRRITRRR